MNDLISRLDAIKAIEDLQDCYNGFSDSYDKACIIGVLEEVPSAQPEIIRCKECKHWYDAPAIDEYNSCELDALIRHKDFYCANAERRTDG